MMVTKNAHKKSWILPILLLLAFISLPIWNVQADIGPKPEMDFEFEFETDETYTILSGMMFECEHPDCSDAKPLEELGPQRFTCDATSCFSLAYGYRDYHRLEILFSDGKTRQSNVFESDSFNMSYRVRVRENDLIVEKIRGRSNPLGMVLIGSIIGVVCAVQLGLALLVITVLILLRAGENKATWEHSRVMFIVLWVVMGILLIIASLFSLSIPITLAVETTLTYIYTIIRRRPKLVILTMVALANMLTLPILWMGANVVGSSYSFLILIVAEIIIWLVESVILYFTQRKTVLLKEMLLLSFVLNLVSFLLGLILPF